MIKNNIYDFTITLLSNSYITLLYSLNSNLLLKKSIRIFHVSGNTWNRRQPKVHPREMNHSFDTRARDDDLNDVRRRVIIPLLFT